MQENPPQKRFLVGCSSPFMRLAQHLTALRAWCKQCNVCLWSVETRRAPSRHFRDAGVFGGVVGGAVSFASSRVICVALPRARDRPPREAERGCQVNERLVQCRVLSVCEWSAMMPFLTRWCFCFFVWKRGGSIFVLSVPDRGEEID